MMTNSTLSSSPFASQLSTLDAFPSITAFAFHTDGLSCAVGTASGHVLLYDLRRKEPMVVKDHQYGLAIKSISFHSTGNVVSADSKCVRIWSKESVSKFFFVMRIYVLEPLTIFDVYFLGQGIYSYRTTS